MKLRVRAAAAGLALAVAVFASAAASRYPKTIGDLVDLRIPERDASGRARVFELVGRNDSVTVQGSAFRRAIGPRTLRSLLITAVQHWPDSPDIDIEGGGLGHGVGLCQWGAHGMALTGAGSPAILAYYFPGTVVEDLER